MGRGASWRAEAGADQVVMFKPPIPVAIEKSIGLRSRPIQRLLSYASSGRVRRNSTTIVAIMTANVTNMSTVTPV
jgi:hypothetical protein